MENLNRTLYIDNCAEERVEISGSILSVTTSSSSFSGDDTPEGKTGIPASLITAENYLNVSEDAVTVRELEGAVDQCKDMVLDSAECSEERKWLVRRLIELRLRLQEAREAEENRVPAEHKTKVVAGHHLVLQDVSANTTKLHCDRCAGIIWSVIHAFYRCSDCQYQCHVKCLTRVCRVCAHVRVAEKPAFTLDICPELGLSLQMYRCFECKTHITHKNSWIEPRLCDYDGRYYCSNCHWNSSAVVPARVVHNWDFEERRVSRASRQILEIMRRHPVIKLQQLNPRLFSFVDDLSAVRQIRVDLLMMKKYFVSCKAALESRLVWQLKDRQHLMETSDMYSLQDLVDVHSGQLLFFLDQVQATFLRHIKADCKLCFGRGYVCELCDDEEVIFPFDSTAASCPACLTVFHKCCYARKNSQCPKCARILERAQQGQESNAEH